MFIIETGIHNSLLIKLYQKEILESDVNHSLKLRNSILNIKIED